VVNTLPDMAVSPIFSADERLFVGALARAFNDVLVRKGRQYGAEIVDLHAPSQDEVPANASLFSADNYHPSDAGYARWADFMWRGIEGRLEDGG
jgi:acyl-CoA thioesterase I